MNTTGTPDYDNDYGDLHDELGDDHNLLRGD